MDVTVTGPRGKKLRLPVEEERDDGGRVVALRVTHRDVDMRFSPTHTPAELEAAVREHVETVK